MKIDAVCVPIGDSSLPRLKRSNVFILESNNPNTDVIGILDKLSDKIVLSINNKFILEDFLLTSGPTFLTYIMGLYNITVVSVKFVFFLLFVLVKQNMVSLYINYFQVKKLIRDQSWLKLNLALSRRMSFCCYEEIA